MRQVCKLRYDSIIYDLQITKQLNTQNHHIIYFSAIFLKLFPYDNMLEICMAKATKYMAFTTLSNYIIKKFSNSCSTKCKRIHNHTNCFSIYYTFKIN